MGAPDKNGAPPSYTPSSADKGKGVEVDSFAKKGSEVLEVDGQETERIHFEGFALDVTPPLTGSLQGLPGGAVLHFKAHFADHVLLSSFEAQITGRSCGPYGGLHEFLKTPCFFHTPSSGQAAAPTLSWEMTLPRTLTCKCETGHRSVTPLPHSTNGLINDQPWDVRYQLKLEMSEFVDKKGKFRFGLKRAEEKRSFYVPVHVDTSRQTYDDWRQVPLLEEQCKRMTPRKPQTADRPSRWVRDDMHVAHFRRLPSWAEPSSIRDWGLTTIELAHTITTPSIAPTFPSFRFSLSASLGIRRYPDVQEVHRAAMRLNSTVNFALYRVTITIGNGDEVSSESEQIELRLRGTGEFSSSVEVKEMEVRLDQRIVSELDAPRERGEEVFIDVMGSLEARDPRNGDKPSGLFDRVRTCRIEVRYDLWATFTLGADGSAPVAICVTDVRLDLPAARASPLRLTDSKTAGPSVAVDSERYPALAALYGGTRSVATSSSSSAPAPPPEPTGTLDDGTAAPPAYEPSSTSPPPDTLDRKSPGGPSSSASPPPPAAADSFPAPLPPSWEDTVVSDANERAFARVAAGEDPERVIRDEAERSLRKRAAAGGGAAPTSAPPVPEAAPPPPPPASGLAMLPGMLPRPLTEGERDVEAPPTWEDVARDDALDDWKLASFVYTDAQRR
ncbi:hypothetical protein JCM10207_008549 [Rhodosporidiobolus poonsookiae]